MQRLGLNTVTNCRPWSPHCSRLVRPGGCYAFRFFPCGCPAPRSAGAFGLDLLSVDTTAAVPATICCMFVACTHAARTLSRPADFAAALLCPARTPNAYGEATGCCSTQHGGHWLMWLDLRVLALAPESVACRPGSAATPASGGSTPASPVPCRSPASPSRSQRAASTTVRRLHGEVVRRIRSRPKLVFD